MVQRVYVEKKPGFDGEAQQIAQELRDTLGMGGLREVRLLNRYDVEGASDELFATCIPTVFSEPQTDKVFATLDDALDAGEPGGIAFAVEYLPGQFDQRASSASECMQLISQGARPDVLSARVYVLYGTLGNEQLAAIKRYLINPVESREASLEARETVRMEYPVPADVEVLKGFTAMSDEQLLEFIAQRGLAMDLADAQMCREYFAAEHRDPTITEIKVVDTYWSDHCRHTTFNTQLDAMEIEDPQVKAAYERYLEVRHELGRDAKPVCLMDMGTIGARYLKAKGILTGLDESEEINACTVKVKCDVDGEEQDWLYLFKNETHNHPTEIEPFGGAATCVGGAIRDPLSGRSYVYQAMRLTGAGNPLAPVADTLPGKLPQRKIVTTAAAGYSSYGNQIGLATGAVQELYHPGYVAKRMEIGAVVGATPASHVRRETPAPGDVVVLLGGGTGRDGIGGATGSSKAHKESSLESCGAEVQKGNAPMERKLQRLFRRKDACQMIKRCNDFGAGGVSVAIGELADGLQVNLDAVPRKYDGLDGTELAISESQERMAVALAPHDVDAFIALAAEENLQAVPVAQVTEEPRVRMAWRGSTIVDLSREFLASNGAPKHQRVHVAAAGAAAQAAPGEPGFARDGFATAFDECPQPGMPFPKRMAAMVRDMNIASNKGLSERFDSTIGAATVLMPFGGANQLTPAQAMAAKLPVDGHTTTCSGMAWGYNPYLTSADEFRGSYVAVVESLAKLVASGFERRSAYLTFQEYFGSLRGDAHRWGKPVAALLGSCMAQFDLGVGSIGGKDSMSGSFEGIDVPSTLVSFATAVGKVGDVTSPEFKAAGNRVVALVPRYEGVVPFAADVLAACDAVHALEASGQVLSAATPGFGGMAEWLFKMCVGNAIGLRLDDGLDLEALFGARYGSFILELAPDALLEAPQPAGDCAGFGGRLGRLLGESGSFAVVELGRTQEAYRMDFAGGSIDLSELQEAWESRMEPVFPYRRAGEPVETVSFTQASPLVYAGNVAKPRVVIPVFPGTNCEYDTARAFELAGAAPQVMVINNLTPENIARSASDFAAAIRESQMIMIPGGFSGGDEPDGSAKFITAFFRAPQVTEAVRDLLQCRDGLMLGICNGFQALIKLGLVPFGDIQPMDGDCATLTFNTIGRHQSRLVRTRVASSLSPWLGRCKVGEVHTVAISHGEGRFVCPPQLLESLRAQGQIATQYVDADGRPSMDWDVNPNESLLAIEGITSPDGRVLGKMGHSERTDAGLYKNVPGNNLQPIFQGGVDYFA